MNTGRRHMMSDYRTSMEIRLDYWRDMYNTATTSATESFAANNMVKMEDKIMDYDIDKKVESFDAIMDKYRNGDYEHAEYEAFGEDVGEICALYLEEIGEEL